MLSKKIQNVGRLPVTERAPIYRRDAHHAMEPGRCREQDHCKDKRVIRVEERVKGDNLRSVSCVSACYFCSIFKEVQRVCTKYMSFCVGNLRSTHGPSIIPSIILRKHAYSLRISYIGNWRDSMGRI